jgi:hypothetical protein
LIKANNHAVEPIVTDQHIRPGPEDLYAYLLVRCPNHEFRESLHASRPKQIARPTAKLEPGQPTQRGVPL